MTFEHTWAVYEIQTVDDEDVIRECHTFDSENEALQYARECMTPKDRFESDIRHAMSMSLRARVVYSLYVEETEWARDEFGTVVDYKKVKIPFYLDWGYNDEMMELDDEQ